MFRKLASFFVDLGILLALNLAFFGFSVNGISARLAILPFYDFLSIPIYQITLGLMTVSSVLISLAVSQWRRKITSLVLLVCGALIQSGTIISLIFNRTLYEPVFLVLSEDPGLHDAMSQQASFYVAPFYEIIDVITFVFFMVGVSLLFTRLSLRFGTLRSTLMTILAGSGLLLYFEYVTLNPGFVDGSASSIPGEKLTNFSNGWPLVGSLTNIEFFWISAALFITSCVTYATYSFLHVSWKNHRMAREKLESEAVV